MNNKIYLSLCIPTNGIIEWVIPVLESIYAQNIDMTSFEVIVTDNGSNAEFQKKMERFSESYCNFVYKKTTAIMFHNQIEAFKLAKGMLIKFINHRMIMTSGSLQYLITFVRENMIEKPTVYFANGCLKSNSDIITCSSFDEFLRRLSYWSSWSAGTAMWKTDFDKIDFSDEVNTLFPHTRMLFFNKDKSTYLINNRHILEEIPIDNTKKGNYDLFSAFAVEYPMLLKQLYDARGISKSTYDYIIKENGLFISKLYFLYVVRKEPCSYDLSGYNKAVGQFYTDLTIKRNVIFIIFQRIVDKFRYKFIGVSI